MRLLGDNNVEFEAFVRDYQGRLLKQAYLLTGDPHRAEDLAQSAFIQLYKKWGRVDHPIAYTQKVLLNEVLNESRRTRRRRENERLTVPPAAADQEAASRVSLMAALADLPPRMRAVVVLRFWEDLSVAQTAQALDCTAGTVKSTSHKALTRLRAHLGDSFPELVLTPTERNTDQ